MTKLARRDWLKASAVIAAGATIPYAASSAFAQAPPRNIIIVMANGGWDTTYSLDPKPDSPDIDAPAGTITQFRDIPILTDAARPSVTSFFERYASISAVINGIQVRSFIHSDCMKRVLTGTPSDQRPDFGAITAFEHGRELPVPYLVLGSSALSGPLAAITGRAGTTNQISTLLNTAVYGTGDAISSEVGFRPDETEQGFVTRYLEATAGRVRAERGQTGSNARQVDAFIKSIERQGRLRNFVQTQGGFGDRDYTPDLSVQTGVALSALEGGLCQSVMLESGDFDTHTQNGRQSQLQEAFFAGLLGLIDGLEQRRMLDRTLVVVMSEMGRTPKVNNSMGKDHWPVTSAIVLGAGVAGGQTYGASDSSLGAMSIDLRTGAPNPGGSQLQTSNLIAGLLSIAGVEPEPHFPGVEPFRAIAG